MPLRHTPRPLPIAFFDRPVVEVARDLLGKHLVRRTPAGITIGRIVETEAYLAVADPASHSFRGRTRKNASMFGPPGRAYVYPIHARVCFNVVTEPEGVGSAVLIRAVEPLEGLEHMRSRRGRTDPRDLARGPARLCEAFEIGRSLDGWDLTRGEALWIEDSGEPSPPFEITPRVGVTSAQDLPLRFVLSESRFVSQYKSSNYDTSRRRPLRSAAATSRRPARSRDESLPNSRAPAFTPGNRKSASTRE